MVVHPGLPDTSCLMEATAGGGGGGGDAVAVISMLSLSKVFTETWSVGVLSCWVLPRSVRSERDVGNLSSSYTL